MVVVFVVDVLVVGCGYWLLVAGLFENRFFEKLFFWPGLAWPGLGRCLFLYMGFQRVELVSLLGGRSKMTALALAAAKIFPP